MKKLIRNIMLMLAAPALLLTSCHESFDELNTDPTHMSEANAGSFLRPIMYGMSTYNWNRYDSWTFELMQICVSTSSSRASAGTTPPTRPVTAHGQIITIT